MASGKSLKLGPGRRLKQIQRERATALCVCGVGYPHKMAPGQRKKNHFPAHDLRVHQPGFRELPTGVPRVNPVPAGVRVGWARKPLPAALYLREAEYYRDELGKLKFQRYVSVLPKPSHTEPT